MVESSTLFAIIIPIMLIYIGIIFALYNNDPNKHPLDQTLASLISGIIGGILCTIYILKYNNYTITRYEFIMGIILSGIIAYITYISVVFFTKTSYIPPFQSIINAITLAALCFMFYNFNSWGDKLEFLYTVLFILGSGYILFYLTDAIAIDAIEMSLKKANIYDWVTFYYNQTGFLHKPILFLTIISLWKYIKIENKMANLLFIICLFLIMFFNFISITADVVSNVN